MTSKKNILYLMILITFICTACLSGNKDEGIINADTLSDSASNETKQTISTAAEESDSLSGNIRSYETMRAFPDDMAFADEESVDLIRGFYEKIDFAGEYKKGNLEVYDFYRKKYRQLMENNEKVYRSDGSVMNFEDLYTLIALYNNSPKIYFFDMDEDDMPELCLADIHGTYVIKYEPDTNQYYIWWGYLHSGGDILGSRKIRFSFEGADSYFYQLNKDGVIEYTISFLPITNNTGTDMDLVSLPNYGDGKTDLQLLEAMNQVCYSESNGTFYIRVTEEQGEEISKAYYDARLLAIRERIEVSYFFD